MLWNTKSPYEPLLNSLHLNWKSIKLEVENLYVGTAGQWGTNVLCNFIFVTFKILTYLKRLTNPFLLIYLNWTTLSLFGSIRSAWIYKRCPIYFTNPAVNKASFRNVWLALPGDHDMMPYLVALNTAVMASERPHYWYRYLQVCAN